MVNILGSICVADSEGPTALLSVSSSSATVYETITFDASDSIVGTGSNLSFEIAYGDGEKDYDSSGWFSHSYEEYGVYTVELTVRTSEGFSSTVETVKIFPRKPVAYLSAVTDDSSSHDYSSEIIAGVTRIKFSAEESIDTDLSNAGLSYLFYYGDGTDSDWQDSPISYYVYEDVGEFSAYVLVKNETGSTSESSNSISVMVISSLRAEISANPTRHKNVDVTIRFDLSGCKDLDEDNEIVQYVIDFDDGEVVTRDSFPSELTHVYNRDGEFDVTVTVTNDEGETATASTNIKLGSAFLGEVVFNGGLILGFLVGFLGFLISMKDQPDFFELIITCGMFFVGGFIGGAILGALWFFVELWSLILIIPVAIFLLVAYVGVLTDSVDMSPSHYVSSDDSSEDSDDYSYEEDGNDYWDGGYGGGGGDYGEGGWYGDSEGHSRAAKKGWRNRR